MPGLLKSTDKQYSKTTLKRKERINPFQRRNFHCSGRWQYSTGLAHPGTNAIPDQIHPALHKFGFRSGCSAIPWLPTLSSLQKIVFTVCLEACASCLPQLNPNIPCNYLSSGLSPSALPIVRCFFLSNLSNFGKSSHQFGIPPVL